MNALIQGLELAPPLRIFIDQAGVTWTLGQLILTCLACGVIPSYLLYLGSVGILVSLAVGAVGMVAPIGFLIFQRNQRLARFHEQLPNSLDLIVSALRAGHSFNAALELAAREGAEPVRTEFRICFDEQHYGLDLRDAMDNLMARVPSKDLRIVAAIVLVQRETGGNLAEVLNNTAEIIRERYKLKRQVLVNTAHGRLTGWIIGLLPLVLLILLYTINPSLESLLWKREVGLKLLAAGAAMMCLGCIVIRKITQLDV
jgi:tight adherence protein B